MNISDIKTFIDLIIEVVPFIKTIITGIKSLATDRSQTSEAAQKSLENIVETMSGPDRDKLDAERIRALAELTKSMTPFAFVEYLFYATRAFGVFALVVFVMSSVRRDRKTK